MLKFFWSACDDVGGRDTQQDATAVRYDIGVVADGMGGQAGGAEAASAAVAAVVEELRPGADADDVLSAFHYAADLVVATGSGTTLALLVVEGDRLEWRGSETRGSTSCGTAMSPA
ncbi:MAG: hypothetical protein AB8I08_25695 [Sandaracinaceae bacterium]